MIDKRTKKWKTIKRWFNKGTFACAWLGFIIGAVFTTWLWGKLHPKTSPEPVKPTIEVKAEEYPREYYEADPMRYVRFRGQELGYDDPTIGIFIEIARAESNFRPEAKNPRSTATGIYQFINGTWHSYCKGMNVYDFVDNIDCMYKVMEIDGYPNGLKHWNASRSVWGKYER